MLPRPAPLLLAALLCLGGAGCKEKQTQAERQAGIKAEFRAKQKQLTIKAYKDLVDKYPESEFTAKAKEKLQRLGPPAATPAPKKQ